MDRNRWKTLGKLAVSLIAAGVLAAGVAMPVVLGSGILARNEASRFLDTTCDLQESAPPQKTYMYARDGKTLIATLFTQDRQLVPLSDIPKYLQQALVATEDRRFYSHHGVDLRGLIRSAVSTSGGDTQGGSTLTMQYVKQIRYFQAGDNVAKQNAAIAQNLQRKIEDAKCALYFEGTKHESKATILNNYLNIAFFGENAYGIQTAAETYFDVPAKDLTLAQSAMLVGLLRAPSSFDPYYDPQAALARRNEVLQNLVDVHQLTQAQADAQKATPIVLATKTPPVVSKGCANADENKSSSIPNVAFFCEYAQSWLENVNGISSTELNTGGLKIVTTLDPNIQRSMQYNVGKKVPATSSMTAVMPAIDPATGDVLAMASSKTYGNGKGQTEQPIFTSDTASAASTFKLFPLLTALQTGLPADWQLSTVGGGGAEYKSSRCATPSVVRNGDPNVNYNTVESLGSATAKSDNSYFVKLAEQLLQCQLQPIVTTAEKLGVPVSGANAIVAQQRVQQLVLGSVPISALQLAGAYAAVANNGKFNAPSPILSITDANKNPIAVKRSPGVQVVSPQTAAKAVDILQGDTHTDGTSAQEFDGWYGGANGSEIAGKTGTNEAAGKQNADKNASVWFVGMTKNVVASTGLINFDQPTKPSTGLPGEASGAAYGNYAANIWISALRPTLTPNKWDWTSQDSSALGDPVPDISGMSVDDAKRALASDPSQFKLTVLGQADNIECASSEPPETIGYYGPKLAPPGSTITACQSSSIAAYVPYVPPVVTPPTNQNKPTTRASSGPRSGGAATPTAPASGGASPTKRPGR